MRRRRSRPRIRVPVFAYAENGQWFDIQRRNQLLACCDCGLAHRCDIRIKNRQLQMRAFRLDHETAIHRRRCARELQRRRPRNR
jgi:hypothetical protein